MRVLICDDHPLFGEGFRFLLESLEPAADISLVSTAIEGAALSQATDFDLILLDWNLDDGPTGAEGLALLREAAPGARIVVLSGEKNVRLLRNAVELGAAGFIPKSSPKAMLKAALESVLSGQIYLPPDLLMQAGPSGTAPTEPTPVVQPELGQAFPALTPRQVDVLKIVLRGSPDKLIARELGISPNTVKTHLKTIYALLGVQTRGEAVYLASRRGVRIS